eukprot:1077625-Amphidinium_carterae.4
MKHTSGLNSLANCVVIAVLICHASLEAICNCSGGQPPPLCLAAVAVHHEYCGGCRDSFDFCKEKVKDGETEPVAPSVVAVESEKCKAQFMRDLDVAVIKDHVLPHLQLGALSSANMRKAEKAYSGKRGLFLRI